MRSGKVRAIRRYRITSDWWQRLKALLKRRKAVTALVVVILLAVILISYLFNRYYKYDHYKVISSIKNESTENSKYVPFGNFVVKYSNDGISYIDGSETKWNAAHEMKAPVVDVCGDYLAIADKNTNDVYIYDTKGEKGLVTVSYPITKLEVAAQGVVAVMEEEKDANYIEAYDIVGKKLISHKTLIDENGYPLDFSLSDDGRQLMVSYLSVKNGAFNNEVVFYDFSEKGAKYDNRVSARFDQYGENLVPSVSIISEDYAAAIGENVISIYDISKKPELKDDIEVEHHIEKVFMNDEYLGVAYHTQDKNNPYAIDVYRINGKKETTIRTSLNFENADFAGRQVLLYDDLNCRLIAFNGVEKFRYTFKGDIRAMMPLKDEREFILITNSKIQKIRLK